MMDQNHRVREATHALQNSYVVVYNRADTVKWIVSLAANSMICFPCPVDPTTGSNPCMFFNNTAELLLLLLLLLLFIEGLYIAPSTAQGHRDLTLRKLI